MKKLIFTLVLSTYLTTIQAQKQFEGMWVSDESSYITTILSSEYKIMKVFNASFEEYQMLEEEITSVTKNSFTSSLYNKGNGYSVEMKYRFVNKDTIICEYTGDRIGEIKMTRLKTNNFQL